MIEFPKREPQNSQLDYLNLSKKIVQKESKEITDNQLKYIVNKKMGIDREFGMLCIEEFISDVLLNADDRTKELLPQLLHQGIFNGVFAAFLKPSLEKNELLPLSGPRGVIECDIQKHLVKSNLTSSIFFDTSRMIIAEIYTEFTIDLLKSKDNLKCTLQALRFFEQGIELEEYKGIA